MTLLSLICFDIAYAGDPLIEKSLSIIDERYLWPEELIAKTAFISALREVERQLPWLIVKEDGMTLILMHGTKGEVARYQTENIPFFRLSEELSDVKLKLEEAGKLPPGLDLSVVLLRGVSKSLDRYSVFMEKESLERFNERIRGSLSGIGARIEHGNFGARIIEVFPGGPASGAGLSFGDEITEIDGLSLQGLSLSQMIDRLRGPVGKSVLIGYLADGDSNDLQQVEMQRAMVRIPNVHWRVLQSGMGLIEIDSFSEQTAGWLDAALNDLKDVKGIILDLRGNSGGSMLQSCLTVDAFLKEGIAVQTEGRDGLSPPRLMREYPLEDSGEEPDLPLIILVNHKSASASEIVAGALRLNKRALLIGSQTYGKGLVQMPYTIRSGGPDERVMLKLTIAQYLLKDRYSVHDNHGILPDIQIRPFYFHSEGSYLPIENKGLVYARESEGWRDEPLAKRDFVLGFADDILEQATSTDVEHLLSVAENLLPNIQNLENERIQDAFELHNIDWINGPTVEAAAPQAKFTFEEPILAGQSTTLTVDVHNTSEVDWFQTRIYLNTEDTRLPWDNYMIPIGKISAGTTQETSVSISIPPEVTSRLDEIHPQLYIQDLKVPLPIERVMIMGEPSASLKSSFKLNHNQSTGEAELIGQFSNMGDSVLKDVTAHLFWPNDTPVSYFTEEIRIEELKPDEHKKGKIKFKFATEQTELPDPMIQVSIFGAPSFIRSEISVQNLQNGLDLIPPHINGPPIVQAPEGTLSLRLNIEDDGEVEDVVAWLDGEKIGYFHHTSDIDIKLNIDSGQNTLRVVAYDDQSLQRSWNRHIWGY